MDGQHEGSVLRVQEKEHWGSQEVLGEVAQQGGVPKENESKKEVETGCFMFRLYLLEYLFVGELGYRNN